MSSETKLGELKSACLCRGSDQLVAPLSAKAKILRFGAKGIFMQFGDQVPMIWAEADLFLASL